MLSAQPGLFLGLFTIFHHLSQALSLHARAAPLVSRLLNQWVPMWSWVLHQRPRLPRPVFTSEHPCLCPSTSWYTRAFPGAFVNRIVNSETNFSLNSPRPPALQPGGSRSFPGTDIRQDLLLCCAKLSVPQPP